MYTEENLRATFGTLEDEAPSPATVLAGVDRVRRRHVARRRAAGMLAAAVVAVVVAVGSIVATNPGAPPETGDAATNPHRERIQFPFAVDDIPGYQVAYRFLNFNDQSSIAQVGTTANMTDPNKRDDSYTLLMFKKGGYDPAADSDGEPVQVNGKRGFYSLDMRCQCSSDIGIPGVVWEYAPNSWALVQYQLPTGVPGTVPPADVREITLRIAEAVRFDRHAPVLVPFQLGYLPAGLVPAAEPAEVNVNTLVQGSRGTTISLAGRSRTLDITGGEMFGEQMSPELPVGEPVVGDNLMGRPFVTIVLGEVGVQLSGTGFSVDELKRIARSARSAADIDDPTTWLAADEALPLR